MKKTVKRFLIVFLILAGIFFLIPDHILTALIYQQPDLTDYKIFKNRIVKKGVAHPWPLATNYNLIKPSKAYTDTLNEFRTVAFLVIHRDSLLYEIYNNGFSATTPSNSFSMAKSIVSLLVGCAINDGYIKSIDDKVQPYLPELTGAFAKELTIRHLLTMSSGSSWDESYNSLFSNTTQAYYGDDLVQLFKKIEIIRQPGKTFTYRSGDTQLLAKLLTQATGKTLAEYVSEKLWQPLGAEQDALWSLDHAKGEEKAYCCFNSNARDFARLGSVVLHHGQWNQQQLIHESYIRESLTPAAYLTDKQGNTIEYYGLQWWLMRYKGLEVSYARGILGQYIFVLPERDAIIVRLGHKRSKHYRNHHPLDTYSWIALGLQLIDQNQ